ncbi:MAG: DUF72 domain-containing protein [Candidatus Eisenbacteria sp.]|nr:DUF72 domain-containing protein [Candidatus Eisenbacteria bacterium]
MIRIGTSGYSFADWVGEFYPSGTNKGEMLGHYVHRFDTVEVNSTYYRIPHPTVLRNMERKTGPGFEFIIKANQEMTHKGSRDPSLYRRFREVLEPVKEARKFSGILFQFPWGFKNTADNRGHLSFLKDTLGDDPLFVEFRHDSWIRDEVFEFLKGHGVGYCSVDEPQLPGLVPPIARLTTDTGYVRLHGRNAENWWGRGPGDRYDYLYNEKELSEWARKIRDMEKEVRKVYVFFNNCHAGQAAKNAQLMQEMLRPDNENL